MLTAGLTYRDGIKEKYPPECKNLPCGDYVLKIFAALTGKVYYLADQMVVYRFQSSATAWSVQKLGKKVVHLKDVAWAHDIHMLAAADRFSRNEHMALFRMIVSQHARSLLHMYPHIADEIKDEMGYVLKYSYHAPYIARNRRSVLSKIGYRILRWMYHPYYPFENTPYLLRPFWRRFLW